MLSGLKDHPFAVEAFFDRSVVLSYAVPKDQLLDLIPACLELDLFQERWGFVAVAMVQTRGLRPKGFPSFLGNDFFLIGYRVFVRYTNKNGKRLRGLYILRSQTDKRKMQFFGNLFTHYNYSTIDVSQNSSGEVREITSVGSGLKVSYMSANEEVRLPEGSPFSSWKEARRYAGPLPFTFTFKPDVSEVLIVEGIRQSWKPTPLQVMHHEVSFLSDPKFHGATLANAFKVENIPYQWSKARVEQWGR